MAEMEPQTNMRFPADLSTQVTNVNSQSQSRLKHNGAQRNRGTDIIPNNTEIGQRVITV